MEIRWDYVLVALALLVPFILYGGFAWFSRLRRARQLAILAAERAEPSFSSRPADPVPAAAGPAIGNDVQQQEFPAASPPRQEERAEVDAPPPAASPAAADEADPAAAGDGDEAAGDGDSFPALSAHDLPERFYYIARLSSGAPGFAAAQMLEMSADIVRQARLQKHQLLLGWEGGRWQRLRSESRYRHVAWCIPLCTRSTGIEDGEIAAVTRCIRNWMQRTGGRAQLPQVQEVGASLQEVHQFCEQVDLIVAARLVAMAEDNATVRTCSQILEIAFAHGMENVDGRIERLLNSETLYVMRAANGDDLGGKSPDRKLASIVLELDVPRVTRPRESCEEMFALAGKLSRVLGYRMVNEEGNRIERQHEQQCLQMIDDIVLALREQGIKPGSRLARSLFG